ncbi:hypothetical protein AQ911_12115 [Burkholderia pseudomallei]|nr:hypothetical protein AQ911_12115 [Burkholderia pseudomallei]
MIAGQFGIKDSGRNPVAVIARFGLGEQRVIFEIFNQVLHAVPKFDRDHGKGPVAVLLDKLNFGHL